MNCEKTDSVTSPDLYPSPVTNCHTFSDPFPLERDIFMDGRPPKHLVFKVSVLESGSTRHIAVSPGVTLTHSDSRP